MASERVARAVIIDYTNHRGERSERLVLPEALRYGESQWHPGARWLLDASDLDKGGAPRTFAMDDIHSWRPAPAEGADGQ